MPSLKQFDFATLPRDFPRRYVKGGTVFDIAAIEQAFAGLKGRGISSVEEIGRWLADLGELYSIVYQEKALRYANYSRQTDNPEYRKAFEEFTETLEPKFKLASFELEKKYVSSPTRKRLDPKVYGLFDRKTEADVSTFREQNVELERQDSALAQEYQRTFAAMTVTYRGQERTLQQMSKFLEETDRRVREESWRLANERALRDRTGIDGIYGKLVLLRDSAARNAGFRDYAEFIFTRKHRFDYTSADCVRFHEGVERYLVPLSREIDRRRLEKLGVEELMPWDLKVDPEGKPPLTPYREVEELVGGCAKVVESVDRQLLGYFSKLEALGLLDLESRKGKAPGGFQEEFMELKLPFIFMNAAGKDGDVRTLLHESGHSFHSFLMREAKVLFCNSGYYLPTEFAEVASMSMELMSGEHLQGTFYTPDEAKRSNREELVSMVKLFTWVATIDAFQFWAYTHPDHTPEQRAEAWTKTFSRFAGLESYEGNEEHMRSRWQRQLHLFEVPFYYIEYGIATIGALGIWTKYRRDRRDAVESYKLALSLGASRSLPDLFGAAGLDWDIGPSALQQYAGELRSAIREYE